MKAVILTVFLFMFMVAGGQTERPLMDVFSPPVYESGTIRPVRGVSTSSAIDYVAEADTIFSHMGIPPDEETKGYINTLVSKGLTHGWWNAGDLIMNMATSDTVSALMWWNNPMETAVTYKGPVFAPDSGYAGDGVDGYLKTNFFPSADYVNASMNSVTLAVYYRKYATIGGGYNGCDAGLNFKAGVTILHCSPAGNISHTYPATGMVTVVRTDASTVRAYQDGIYTNENSSSSAIYIPTDAVMLFNYGSYGIYNNDRVAFFYLGGELTDAQVKYMAEDVEEYMYHIGGRATPRIAILGNSTVADNGAGQPSVASLLNDASEYSIQSMAVPGATISGQETSWGTYSALMRHTRQYTFIEVGLNDLSNDGEAFSTVAGRYQSLVNTVRADVGADRKIILCTMTPANAVLSDNAYTKWLQLNEAIMGGGASAITGADYRLNSHTATLNDGSGNLKAEYDSGDGIHPNESGRQVIADTYETILKP